MPRWLIEHLDTILWSAGLSVVLLIASLVIVGVVLVKLPPDYFSRTSRSRAEGAASRARRSVWLRVAKNILGWILILAGLAMLVLPGQGLLVLLIGVMLADFPGKFRVERWNITRKRILCSANWLRDKLKKPPLHIEPRRGSIIPACEPVRA